MPPVNDKEIKNIDINYIDEFFTENGILSKFKNDYEYRQGQKKMAEKITSAFTNLF